MVDCDMFGMTEEESDACIESSGVVDDEIRSIVDLDLQKR